MGVAVVAGDGALLAGWQVAKGSTMTACQADPIGQFVNGLPTADWLPQYFFANGGCADRYDAFRRSELAEKLAHQEGLKPCCVLRACG
ncbi:MAG: disulfide bond formation protein B [Burkholderiales bacterium]